MVSAIIYIGFAQSLFAAVLVLQKKPLHIADKILGILLCVIGTLFFFNIIEEHSEISTVFLSFWPFSLSFTFIIPSLLLLYSKYTINESSEFKKVESLYVILPPLVIFLLIFIFIDKSYNGFFDFVNHFNELTTLRNIIGVFFIANLWFCSLLILKNIKKYRKQIDNLYSFKSDRISLSWLRILTISLLVVYNSSIIISSIIIITTYRNSHIFEDIEVIRKIMLLAFVYIISIWGYKQIQLAPISTSISLNNIGDISKTNTSEKYQKSGLKEDQASQYLQKLIQYMNNSEIWKDNELSIAKLSQYTEIPKHYITQILNENLNKNFYSFINEYRAEYAKKLIKSPKYKAWSFVAIAFECGFNSKTAFNNFFKKYTGMTPSEFKKNEE